ncbi:MAG: hypothetical protein KC591_14495, partial [Gemmatimonadetes bacterium]|nr:hypothetical protein [Gemmatimonadota bacterium]
MPRLVPLVSLAAILACLPGDRAAAQIATMDPESLLLAAEQCIRVTDQASFDLPVVLDAPSGGGSVSYYSTIGPPEGTLALPAGVTGGSIPQTFPDATLPDLGYGVSGRVATAYLTGGGGTVSVGFPGSVTTGWFELAPGRGLGYCYLQAICVITAAVVPGYPFGDCLLGRGGTGVLDTFRRYRDEVLAITPVGQFYTGQYETFSFDMAQTVLAHPTLLVRTLRTLLDWQLPIDLLLNGSGSSVTVSPSMQDGLLDVLDTMEQVGSPALAQAIAFERTRLQLDTLAGKTLTEFQTQV